MQITDSTDSEKRVRITPEADSIGDVNSVRVYHISDKDFTPLDFVPVYVLDLSYCYEVAFDDSSDAMKNGEYYVFEVYNTTSGRLIYRGIILNIEENYASEHLENEFITLD